MIPVINNHTVMNKTEYFINKPQETVNTVSHNSALPSDRKIFNQMFNYNQMDHMKKPIKPPECMIFL